MTITSSDGSNQPFTVGINYGTNNLYGTWLYTSVSGFGSTNGIGFNPATGTGGATFQAQTGLTGASMTIGLNLGIASATPSATVVITPINNPTAVVNITVFYTQNTSCGGNTGSASNNFITVTPGNIALSAPTNGTSTQTLSVQNTTATAMTFTFTVSPTSSWLSATSNTGTISGNGGTASINVSGNASQTAGVGTYNGIVAVSSQLGTQLSLPVVFTVTTGTGTGTGTGSSGTLTLANTNSNTASAELDYVGGQTPAGKCVSLQDTAPGANSYFTQVTTNNGGNWLLANNAISTTTPAILAPGSSACVTVSTSNAISGLASGAYSGSVAITSSSGSTATLNVNLYVSAGTAPGITISPAGNIFVFQNVAANSTVVQNQTFSISGASGYILGTASLTSAANGFSMNSPVASNNTETFTVSANSTGLSTGIYATTVTIPSSFGSGATNTTTITIILPVGQAGATSTGTGGNSTTIVAPPSLAFQQQLNSSYWTGGKEAQDITITGAQGTAWSAAIVYTAGGPQNWLNIDSPSSASGTFGNGPATVAVDLFNGVTGLSASTTPYQATVSITTTNGVFSVPVSLLVTAANTPVLLANPASATFNATTGVSTNSQTVTIVGSDNTASNNSPPITVGTPTATWLTAVASGNTLTLAVNASGQATGVYSATVPVQATAYGNTLNYPVVLIVNNGGGGTGSGNGPLTLSTSTIAFTNVTASLSQNFNVSAANSTNVTAVASETNCANVTWLTIGTNTFTASTTPTSINVQVNPTGIANGQTCNGVISLITSTTQTVSVSMTVGPSNGGGNITVSPTSMTFAYTQNQSVPPAQNATIVNTTTGTASIPFTVTTSENNGTSNTWLLVSASSATTPYNSPGLSVSVAPGSLNPGTYTGTVTITPTGGSAQTIGVTLTVTGSAVITATVQGASTGNTTNMALTYQVGGNSPTGTILVSGGGSAAGFTATASSSQGWLQVSPTSGTTPNSGTSNLTVSIVPTVLSSLLPSATPYTGTITIAPVAPATGTTNINVSLTVSAPLPVITGVTNAASGAVGAVSPGELISIFANPVNPIGPTNAVVLNSTTCPSPCTLVPTTMGGVTVKFLPGGYLAPLIFVTAGQINAVVPYEIAGQVNVSVEVLYLNQSSNAFPLNVAATAPGIFTANSSGTGPAAAIQYTPAGAYANVNSSTNPAGKGYYLVLYLTGEGKLTTNVADGSVTSNTTPGTPIIAPTGVLIGGQPATIAGYSEAPGIVSGVLQINVIVPNNAGTGPQPVSVSFGSTASQANVTVYLQ